MIPVILTFDEAALKRVSARPALVRASPDEDPLSVNDLRDLLAALDTDSADVHTIVEYPEWEKGKPCPECGGHSISVLSADEDIYDSFGGELQYVQRGDATGGKLSALCPECMTRLFDTPVEQLWR